MEPPTPTPSLPRGVNRGPDWGAFAQGLQAHWWPSLHSALCGKPQKPSEAVCPRGRHTPGWVRVSPFCHTAAGFWSSSWRLCPPNRRQVPGIPPPTSPFPGSWPLLGLGASQSPSPQVWESPRLAGGVLVLTRGDPSVPTAILFLLTPGKQQSQDTLSAGQHEKEADSWGLLAAVCSPRNEYLQSPGETEKGTRLQCNYIS